MYTSSGQDVKRRKDMQKNSKRILSVAVKTMFDDSPDTSWLGLYSDTRTSSYSIDRAHADDCASVSQVSEQAKQTLEHAQQTVGDLHNAVLAQYNGTLANEKLDTERDALDEAYNQLGVLADEVIECDCHKAGRMDTREYRYFNPSFNYVDKHGVALPEYTPEEVRKYVRQDFERMEGNSGQWYFIDIRAEAEYVVGSTGSLQRVRSGGLWGIESDSDAAYLESVKQDELAD